MIDQAARLRAMMSGEDEARPVVAPAASKDTGSSRIIAVTSGKGGVGKTVVSVNLAMLLAEMGHSVLIVDADLGLANVDVMLGIDSVRHIGHLLGGSFSPDEIAAMGPRGVRIISGGSGLSELGQAGTAERQIILKRLQEYYREYEYIVVDTSPGISCGVTDFLADADEIVLVTTPEPTSLRDTYAALKTIHFRLPESRVRLVVNSAVKRQAECAVQAVNEVAGKFLGRRIDLWQHIEPDTVVGRSVRDRKPLAISYPRSAAVSCLRHLAKAVIQTGKDR